MFSSVVPLVQLQLKYLSNLGLQLIKWNAKRHQFFSTGSNQRNIRLVLGTLFVIVLNGFYTIFLQRHHARSLVQLFTAAFATALAITSTILCKPDPFVYLMNMTIQFEAKCFPKLGKSSRSRTLDVQYIQKNMQILFDKSGNKICR